MTCCWYLQKWVWNTTNDVNTGVKADYKATSSQRNRLRRGTLKCSMQDRQNVQLCSGLYSPSTVLHQGLQNYLVAVLHIWTFSCRWKKVSGTRQGWSKSHYEWGMTSNYLRQTHSLQDIRRSHKWPKCVCFSRLLTLSNLRSYDGWSG